jgi:hypothetical protein
MEDKMVLLDVVIGQCMAILELLASENKVLLVKAQDK